MVAGSRDWLLASSKNHSPTPWHSSCSKLSRRNQDHSLFITLDTLRPLQLYGYSRNFPASYLQSSAFSALGSQIWTRFAVFLLFEYDGWAILLGWRWVSGSVEGTIGLIWTDRLGSFQKVSHLEQLFFVNCLKHLVGHYLVVLLYVFFIVWLDAVFHLSHLLVCRLKHKISDDIPYNKWSFSQVVMSFRNIVCVVDVVQSQPRIVRLLRRRILKRSLWLLVLRTQVKEICYFFGNMGLWSCWTKLGTRSGNKWATDSGCCRGALALPIRRRVFSTSQSLPYPVHYLSFFVCFRRVLDLRDFLVEQLTNRCLFQLVCHLGWYPSDEWDGFHNRRVVFRFLVGRVVIVHEAC